MPCTGKTLHQHRAELAVHMFTVTLFTIVKLGKQPRCLSTSKKSTIMCHIYTMNVYSTTEKNKIALFTGN